jgi:lipopolysaccharide/colanic/teichoic acid biosynthesis glycosyltransferase
MDRQEITLTGVITDEATALPAWKRALDLTLILIASPGLLLIGVAVAVLIKAGSRGPVFFRQGRVGYKGREFVLFKFRTMAVGAETDTHRLYAQKLMNAETPMTKLDAKKDPRVIPFGGLLRATGLDELPQFLNVLRAEMSIVGPRPCLPYEYELYEPRQRRRFDAVPGLTGLWQVSGKNRTTFNQMIQFDIEYSERRSLGLDLKIILLTLPALWTQCRDMKARKTEMPKT